MKILISRSFFLTLLTLRLNSRSRLTGKKDSFHVRTRIILKSAATCIFAMLLLVAQSVSAQTTTYRFLIDTRFGPVSGSYGEVTQLSGEFTLDNPIPPNQVLLLPEGTPYRLDLGNGLVYDNSNSTARRNDMAPGTTTVPIAVITDSNGDITTLSIYAISPRTPHELSDLVDVLVVRVFPDVSEFKVFYSYQGECGALLRHFQGDEPNVCVGFISNAFESLISNIVWTIDQVGEMGCDQFDGKLGGICNAYCAGVNCDEEPDKRSCEVLADQFVNFGGNSTVPPCSSSPTGG